MQNAKKKNFFLNHSFSFELGHIERGKEISQHHNSPLFLSGYSTHRAFQVVLVVKNLPDNAGDIRDAGSILGLGRSPGGGHGNLLQYSCLENPKDRGAWHAEAHRVTESDMTEAT